MTHIAIIGNGIAGITAARRLRQLQPDWRITVISGESTYHYARPALMYIFMGHMRYADTKPYPDDLWPRERIDLVRAWVTGIDTEGRTLTLHRGAPIAFDKLLVATGSRSNRFGWPGQDLPGVVGFYDLMDLRAIHERVRTTRRAVIVGGGLIGIELAEMLHARGIAVTILVRESSYWRNVLPAEESAMVTRLLREAGFDLRLGTELDRIEAGPDGCAARVVTSGGDTIEAQLVGLTAGVSPNVELVRDTPIAIGRGILVNESLETSVPGIYAAGDCAEIVRPGAERNLQQQVWYTGRRQGTAVAEAMAGRAVAYDPGLWFNSAKFLDLEYQTYGTVLPDAPPGERRLWWEAPRDAAGLHGIRIAYRADDRTLLGVNVMGIRHRHEVWEQWLRAGRTVDHALEHLAEANFDSELFRRHEGAIVAAWREELGREQLERKREVTA